MIADSFSTLTAAPTARGKDVDVSKWPKLSIVTPSYNQGRYIETTIRSLITQNYPNLEYFIYDNMSTDETQSILTKYREFPQMIVIQPDRGAADAIARGMRAATGELFNWLNSDDYLFGNTLKSLGVIARKYPHFDIYAFCGGRTWANGPTLSNFSPWPRMDFNVASCLSIFGQESTFVRLEFLRRRNIRVRPELSNIFDVVLYEEMLAAGARVLFINCLGGLMFHHEKSKTAGGTPASDYEFTRTLHLFHVRQRIWRRAARTRMASLQRLCFSLPLFREAATRIFGLKRPRIAYCSFRGPDLREPACWTISSKPSNLV
jgi:glycosyltransferase involved in cell wall biosynthesis